VIDVGVMKDLSGLAQAITFTIRVICRVNFKTVSVPESCLGITLSHNKAGWAGWLICSFRFKRWLEGAANVPDSVVWGNVKSLGNEKYIFYSYRSASTGFLVAALKLCQLTVNNAIVRASNPARANIHKFMLIR
jgi:hypothetical protein